MLIFTHRFRGEPVRLQALMVNETPKDISNYWGCL